MSEHQIQLRGGWEILGPSNAPRTGRLTLPSAELARTPGPVQLLRQFQKPPLNPGRETLWLRLDAVPGLRSVVVNDLAVALGPFSSGPLLFPLEGTLPWRNRILLDIEFPPVPDETPWGLIALLIREVNPD